MNRDTPTTIFENDLFNSALCAYEQAALALHNTDEADRALYITREHAWYAAYNSLCAVIDSHVALRVAENLAAPLSPAQEWGEAQKKARLVA